MQQNHDPFVNSAKNYSLHEYINRDHVAPLLQEQLSYASAGHLLETYVDALHVTLLLDEPAFLRKINEAPETIRNPSFIRPSHRLPPQFVIQTLGNYLESPSFFVKHTIGQPNEPTRQDTQQPSATQFAQEVHGLLRQVGLRFSERLTLSYYPPRGLGDSISIDERCELRRNDPQGAVANFKNAIDDYKLLFQRFSNDYRIEHFVPGNGEPTARATQLTPAQKKIIFEAFEASPQLVEFNQRLEPIIEKLRRALSTPALKSIFVTYAGETCRLDNAPLSPKFAFSSPALTLLALSFVGRHQIDRTFFPKQAFNFTLSVLGVESNVSDNLELLKRQVSKSFSKSSITFTDDILFSKESRALFVESIKEHSRGIQFLHLFHKTVGLLEKIYPDGRQEIAYQDMRQLLALGGAEVEIQQLEHPREAATLIYAIERRLRVQSELDTEFYNQIGTLLNKAGHLGRKNSFAIVHPKLKQDILSHLQIIEGRDDLNPQAKRELLPAIHLIRAAFDSTL